MLIFVEMQIALGLLVFGPKYAVRGSELSHDQAASAEVANKAAENGVGNAGHRGEHSSGRDLDGADLEKVGNGSNLPWCADALVREIARVVPELPHNVILL
jgi:hypothetical protein